GVQTCALPILFQEKRAKSNVDREKGPTLLGELALTNEKYSWYELERDVVVDVLEVGRGLAAPGRTPGAPAPAAAGRRAAARPIAATAATADLAAAVTPAEHLHLLGDDLGGPAILALLVLPLARLQPALDVDRAARAEVFVGDLAQAVEEDHPVPFGVLPALAGVPVLADARGGDRDVADRAAVGRIAHLRVATEVADQDHLVDRCHVASVEFSSARRRLGDRHPSTTLWPAPVADGDKQPQGQEPRAGHEHRRAVRAREYPASDGAAREQAERLRRVVDAEGRALGRGRRQARDHRRQAGFEDIEAPEEHEQQARDGT